jgi:hypothetical protein
MKKGQQAFAQFRRFELGKFAELAQQVMQQGFAAHPAHDAARRAKSTADAALGLGRLRWRQLTFEQLALAHHAQHFGVNQPLGFFGAEFVQRKAKRPEKGVTNYFADLVGQDGQRSGVRQQARGG